MTERSANPGSSFPCHQRSTEFQSGNSQHKNSKRPRSHGEGDRAPKRHKEKSTSESRARGGHPRRQLQRHQKQQQGQRQHHARKAPPAGASKCSVCQETESPRYKCPKCRATYCGIGCCRKHKEQPCSAAEEEVDNPSSTSKYLKIKKSTILCVKENSQKRMNTAAAQPQNFLEKDDSDCEFEINSGMIDALHSCAWLKEELKDVGLRCLIHQVMAESPNVVNRASTATHQQVMLRRLKSEHATFGTFLDKLLVISGVMERREHADDAATLEDWLKRQDMCSTAESVVLKPLPQRQRPEWLATKTTERQVLDNGDDLPNSESNSESEESDSSDLDTDDDSETSSSEED